jgi:glycosyltransferase involved in cell wall biosynthesis
MNSETYFDSSLSVGYLSPGWPLDAFANGVVSYIADMTSQLRRMGHRVTIVAADLAASESDASIYDLHQARPPQSPPRRVLDTLAYRIAPWWGLRRMGRRALSVAVGTAIAEQGIQIFEMEESFGLARLLRGGTSIPICVRLHGPWFLNGRAQGAREDQAFRRRVADEGRAIAEADAVTASSSDVLERTRAYYGLALEDAEVIHPPTPPVPPDARWHLEGCDPHQVLFVGRFDRHKGGDLIIQAFARVLRDAPQARLCFVGQDSGFIDTDGRRWTLAEFVDDRLPGARAAGTVTLLGAQPFSSLAALRRKAMVTVVCSRYENAPRALIEAMSLGCPTVAARVGGIPEILGDRIDGLLHCPEHMEDLATQIVTLLNDPGLAAELGRQAAATCERRFYPEVIASRTINFYRRMIPRRKSS